MDPVSTPTPKKNSMKLFIILGFLFLCCLLMTVLAGLLYLFLQNQELSKRVADAADPYVGGNNILPGEPNPQKPVVKPEPTPTPEPIIDWNIVDQTETDETSDYKVDVTYPQIEGYLDVNARTDFNLYVKDAVQNFVNEVKSAGAPFDSGKNFVELDYDVAYKTDRFVSILMTGSNYFGGAHPTPILFAVNYDLENNQVLELHDLFTNDSYLTKISELANVQLNLLFGSDYEESGASASENNFKNFTFDDATLNITFDAYQVGPYALGTPRVEISLSQLNSYLRTDFK